ncbi:hypothetical protein HBA55_13540 [Pseudomaricurvus alkylphenolicus]|uniref:hypothetical protein n=1 Tax=Pseudomaricurvus alkylphenolicus TaxID=1306991 RepID=UPI00141DA295|nr:hypothetical protein [Pseudomaricurvus alkylphenolicus]NIB40619.1 hypothetical protein [Pseudomaricurvus alkylphenolicus]
MEEEVKLVSTVYSVLQTVVVATIVLVIALYVLHFFHSTTMLSLHRGHTGYVTASAFRTTLWGLFENNRQNYNGVTGADRIRHGRLSNVQIHAESGDAKVSSGAIEGNDASIAVDAIKKFIADESKERLNIELPAEQVTGLSMIGYGISIAGFVILSVGMYQVGPMAYRLAFCLAWFIWPAILFMSNQPHKTLELQRAGNEVSGYVRHHMLFDIFTFKRIPLQDVQSTTTATASLELVCDQGPSGLPLWRDSRDGLAADRETIKAFLADSSTGSLTLRHAEHRAWTNLAGYALLMLTFVTLLVPIFQTPPPD